MDLRDLDGAVTGPEKLSASVTMPLRPVMSGTTSSAMTNSTISPPILNGEAKTGIGVSAPIIVVTMVFLIVYRCLKLRKRNLDVQATREEEGGSSEEI